MTDNTVDYLKGQIEALNLVVKHLLDRHPPPPWSFESDWSTSDPLARSIQEGPQGGASQAYREGFADGIKSITRREA